MDRIVPLRITVVDPPAGVTFRIQRGRDELVPPVLVLDSAIVFELGARVREGSPDLDFTGPYVQGPRGGRFLYANSGTRAGQSDSPWTRRAKVHVRKIRWEDVRGVLADEDAVLAVRIAGTAKDGGPACGSVPLLDGGWRVESRVIRETES